MANDLTNNPWVIDTAAATVLTAMRLRVRGVRWVDATTAGHKATIQNAAGKIVWDSTAAAANNVEGDQISDFGPFPDWDGLIVPTLASGKLYIELR